MLGQGGFGITYLGVQVGLNRQVAIKEFYMKEYCEREQDTSQVSLGTSGSREMVERFRQKFVKEAQTIAGLEHPHIIHIHDVFEENGTAYYVMEYLPNSDLRARIPRGGMPESEALGYIRQIGDALTYIHERNILHLDVKPGNILFRGNGEVVLVDFGLSKHYDGTSGDQTSCTPLGISEGYAPTEQYEYGGVSSFSASTDVYSLGATLYCLLQGTRPPKASVVLNDGLPSLPASVSFSTRNAVESALQSRRNDRPKSVDAFLSLLDASVINDDEGTVVDVFPSVHPVSQPSLKRPIWLIPLVLCLLFALCILGLRKCSGPDDCGGEDRYSVFTNTLGQVDTIPFDSIVVDELTLQENHTFSVADKTTPSVTEENKKVDVTVACQLYVTTSPVGVLVYVDGKKIGKTPIEGMDISRGKHTVKLVLEGYDTFTKKYSFGEKPVVINETLVAKVGNVVPNPTFKNESPSQPPLEEGAKVGTINGHVYVDLGLSVKWATMNVGARSPGDYGDYFSWGEIHPKSEYTEENNLTWEKDMGNICGNSAYDAARYHWGGSWRLPTVTEIQELNVKCTWTWTIQDGHNGYEVVGPNGNRIFLPASGISMQSSVGVVGTRGYYWSSLPCENDDSRYAYFMMFLTGNDHRVGCLGYRCWGQNVRPVAD